MQRGGVLVPRPCSDTSQRVAASGGTGDLRITVRKHPKKVIPGNPKETEGGAMQTDEEGRWTIKR